MGNRFENLQNAINKLFEMVGSIQRISAVYETPAIGFEGSPFYNCALWMQSSLNPNELLEIISKIEESLGRERSDSGEYVSRIIDIDILFYEDIIESTAKLTIPHPEIQNRKFVLQPLIEVNAEYVHPKLNKTISELLLTTTDTSVLQKQSKWLVNPIKDIDLSKYNYIAIEGNIGAGKTSLATKIASDFNSKLILERYKDNPFLPKFYEDPARYSFPLEMSFLADRYQQLVDDITQLDLFADAVIADYDVNKSLIFANITLVEEEFALYKKLFTMMHKELPRPDLYVYLYQNTDRLLENIHNRGRDYEQNIQEEYLQKLNKGYLEFIKNQHDDRIKIIDISEMDFVKNRLDYLKILKEISA